MEILISVGILATVGILIVQVIFTTTRANTKSTLLAEVKQNGEFAMDVMSRQIRGAWSIETNCGIEDITTPSAMIRTLENEEITFKCETDGSAARIASVDAQANSSYLTSNTVTIDSEGGATCDNGTLRFSCIAGTGIAQPLTIEFTLRHLGSSTNPTDTAERSCTNTINVRN